MTFYESFAAAYIGTLERIIQTGDSVPSVTDPLSKASDFGRRDRPSTELLGYSVELASNPRQIPITPTLPFNSAYAFALVAWSLAAHDDLASLQYYRPGAVEFSDDGYVLSGAFGRRMFGASTDANQVESVITRLEQDPASRRTWISIANERDNIAPSREYPCAAGAQLFVREGSLHFLTFMRAQQALTVFPYDWFLFQSVHDYIAIRLGLNTGRYTHIAGTAHIYQDEHELARGVIRDTSALPLPPLQRNSNDIISTMATLNDLEFTIRNAVVSKDDTAMEEIAARSCEDMYLDYARCVFLNFGFGRLGSTTRVRPEMSFSSELDDALFSEPPNKDASAPDQ
jgi:thymidylate synthase